MRCYICNKDIDSSSSRNNSDTCSDCRGSSRDVINTMNDIYPTTPKREPNKDER